MSNNKINLHHFTSNNKSNLLLVPAKSINLQIFLSKMTVVVCCSTLQCVTVCCSVCVQMSMPRYIHTHIHGHTHVYINIINLFKSYLKMCNLRNCKTKICNLKNVWIDAGSRINFRITFPKLLAKSSFRSRDFKVCFTGYSTDISLCLWSGFIYPTHLPELKHLIEKRFSCPCSEKETSGGNPGGSVSRFSFSKLLLQSKNIPTRLLGLLEKQSKIWRYGRLWKLDSEKSFGNVAQNWSCYQREICQNLQMQSFHI